MSTNQELCTTRDAADLLGISLRTAQLWVESGVLRAWKTAGGHRRVLRSSVEELLREREIAVAAPAADQLKLLFVEDEPDLLNLYRFHVESWELPVTVYCALNGFDGLIGIGKIMPDILVADLNMPGMDGFRMLRTLQANPEYSHMEMIAATALTRAEIEDRGGLPSGVRIFTKPVRFSELEALVRSRVEAIGSGRFEPKAHSPASGTT